MLAKRFQLVLEDLRDGVRLGDRPLERENVGTNAFEFLMKILLGVDRRPVVLLDQRPETFDFHLQLKNLSAVFVLVDL